MNFRMTSVSENWWILLLRGIIAVLFGLAIFAMPGLTLVLLILLFGAFALVDGILLIVNSLMNRTTNGRWWLRLLQGVVAILAGIAVFAWPGISALILLYVIAFNAIFGGIFQAISALIFRKAIHGEVLLIAGGIISVIFGVLLIMYPLSGALALAKVIGIFETFYGILLIVMSIDLLSMGKSAPVRT
jgi:uncharacterized membrane protein HdeD (DUF308 family)